ncbi:MAG: c-type cytochrome, partial [Candidatus Eremiobacteraeota bacterium]|nr:c-type cytochrome [Candidatus Eremiobacteraeota bacterium]
MVSLDARLIFAAVLVAAAWMLPAARAAEPPPDVARGRHIATAMTHCTGCHAADLGGGRSFPVGTNGGRVVAGNLTAGAGGIGNAYSDADYIRAIRQGVRPDGTRLAIMPSADFAVLTDRDAASLVAYIRSLPPVDRSFPSDSASADVGMPPAHAAATPASMVAAPSSLGAYVAQLGSCIECHG